MKPPSCSRPQPPLVAPTRSSHSSGVKWCIRLHPSYLLATIVAILPIKLMSATSLPRISFVIIVEKRNIRKLSILPSSWNKNNSNYHGKIYKHLLLLFNQKPKHLSLQLMFSPSRVILVRMFRRRRCFKPMLLKFKLYIMNLNP